MVIEPWLCLDVEKSSGITSFSRFAQKRAIQTASLNSVSSKWYCTGRTGNLCTDLVIGHTWSINVRVSHSKAMRMVPWVYAWSKVFNKIFIFFGGKEGLGERRPGMAISSKRDHKGHNPMKECSIRRLILGRVSNKTLISNPWGWSVNTARLHMIFLGSMNISTLHSLGLGMQMGRVR